MFILVAEKLVSHKPEELKVDGQCELVWAQVQVSGTSQLFIGSFYRPPDENNQEYLSHFQSACQEFRSVHMFG